MFEIQAGKEEKGEKGRQGWSIKLSRRLRMVVVTTRDWLRTEL